MTKRQFEEIRDRYLADPEMDAWELFAQLEGIGLYDLSDQCFEAYDKGWRHDGRGYCALEEFLQGYEFSSAGLVDLERMESAAPRPRK